MRKRKVIDEEDNDGLTWIWLGLEEIVRFFGVAWN